MRRRFFRVGGALLVLAGAALATRAVSGRHEPAAAVEGIYPTASRLPANLLRLYVVFSEPMSIGESHAHLRLVDESGRRVDGAFLELEEELWDPSRRRLTVLLDPGRIKRGLRANLESGAPLVEGRRYRLEIDAAWRDGRGRPLGQGAWKAIEVVAPDRAAPDVDAWAVEPPIAGTSAPLAVRFPEPLDRALLSSAMAVEDEAGVTVDGRIDVADGERRWTFIPDRPWTAGRYALRVSAEMEDVAGNSLRRIFDADLTRDRAARDQSDDCVRRRFTVAPAS